MPHHHLEHEAQAIESDDVTFTNVGELRDCLARLPAEASVRIETMSGARRSATLAILAGIDEAEPHPSRVPPSMMHRVTRVCIAETTPYEFR